MPNPYPGRSCTSVGVQGYILLARSCRTVALQCYPNSKYASGIANKNDRNTRSIHIIIRSFMFSGMSVARIHGMDPSRKRISEILTTATTNFTSRMDSLLRMAGMYISAKPAAAPLANKEASGTPRRASTG